MDAEVILGYLKKAGFNVSGEVADVDVAIVNTCCFIRQAQEESIDIILKLGQLKREGRVGKIVVCGCLAQRYQEELINEFKEVDAFVGVGALDKVAVLVRQLLDGVKPRAGHAALAGRRALAEFGRPKFLYSHSTPRELLTPRHFAYVKICEGCNHACSFCIIPSLRGRYRSRPMASILQEAQMLFNTRRVAEINLIGQDTTMYGQDLYAQAKLAALLAKLSAKAKGKWLRLLYTHPAHFPPELITVIKDNPPICKYIDLPIQHINDKILKKMNRRTSRRQILSLIETLRKEIPHLAIRTTLIVGFPGETNGDFKELLDFIREVRFERLGLFKYSREEHTLAYNFDRQIPEKVKQFRYEQALSLQQDISAEINQGFLGKQVDVLVDEQDEQDKSRYLGRTRYDAPEVDGCVYVRSKKRLKIGDFVKVKVIDTLEYDLVAEAV